MDTLFTYKNIYNVIYKRIFQNLEINVLRLTCTRPVKNIRHFVKKKKRELLSNLKKI